MLPEGHRCVCQGFCHSLRIALSFNSESIVVQFGNRCQAPQDEAQKGYIQNVLNQIHHSHWLASSA